MQNVVQDFRAELLVKALAKGNSFNQVFVPPTPTGTSPDPSRSIDGFIVTSSLQGIVCPGRLKLIPFCDAPNSNFSMRLYAYSQAGSPDPNPFLTQVWVPYLLAEFACTSSATITGPSDAQPGVSTRTVKDIEYFCDTITLTQGNLGVNGFINSTGPGTNLIAVAMQDIMGAVLVYFDFQQTDPNVGMNCLVAKA